MARITTKEYVAARQMKKNGGCIPGDKPGGAVSVCVIGEGVDKQTTANRACDRFGGNVGHQKLRRRKQRKTIAKQKVLKTY